MPGQFNSAIMRFTVVHGHCLNSKCILKQSDACCIQKERRLTRKYSYLSMYYLRRDLPAASTTKTFRALLEWCIAAYGDGHSGKP